MCPGCIIAVTVSAAVWGGGSVVSFVKNRARRARMDAVDAAADPKRAAPAEPRSDDTSERVSAVRT